MGARMNITRKWRKWLAVGCSHGNLICPKARSAVLKFRNSYSPHHVMHLGDFWDTAALRSGASGTKDEGRDIGQDCHAGVQFLMELEPHWIFFGNHDDRVEQWQNHPNAVKAYVAGRMMSDLYEAREKLRAKLIPYDIETGWRRLGSHLFGHGYMYNEMAIRDHAELVGNCVIAHLHRTGEERGRRLGGATGYCVGLLADIDQLQYARRNKATTKWQQAFAYGEYCDNATTINLCKRADNGIWRLP